MMTIWDILSQYLIYAAAVVAAVFAAVVAYVVHRRRFVGGEGSEKKIDYNVDTSNEVHGVGDDGEEELNFVDETGQEEVTVLNGAGPDGLEFNPQNVKISVGTTVTWEWTGDGGQHNVVHDPEWGQDDTGADEPVFESELTGEEGHEYSHTFEETGTYYYVCELHLASGMDGHVRVV